MAGVRMDYWREYFRSANADIFEIIERAIMLAASDCPKEFQIRRDNIAQILFSSTFINHSSACHHHAHDHADDEMLVNIKRRRSSSSSKVIINCSRNDSYDDDDDAEALTDEIDQQSQTFSEVMRIKDILDNNSPHESASLLCNSLRNLQLMSISVETLKATEIGKSVIVLRKHASKDVRQIARSLIEVWKDMVDEWVNATTKITVSENTPESINPTVLDEEEEEEGLPSPPLDDLAFLNPHSMSLELSEKFFDGMDDYGNPQKSEKCNNRKPPVEKQNVTKWKSQKPSNKPTMVPKPCKPPVVDSTPGRRMNPNMDQRLQQRKAMSSGGVTDQDKLEATKRKLQERYQQAEKAKRQRTIQVMELQDLPKQEVTQKQQNVRPGNNHYRQRGNGRF